MVSAYGGGARAAVALTSTPANDLRAHASPTRLPDARGMGTPLRDLADLAAAGRHQLPGTVFQRAARLCEDHSATDPGRGGEHQRMGRGHGTLGARIIGAGQPPRRPGAISP